MRSSVLSEPALVLNKSWLPLRVCTARRALILLFKDLARAMGDHYSLHDFGSWVALDLDGRPCVRSVSLRIPVPEVIVLRDCDRYLPTRVVYSRRNLFRRDHNTCQYCGQRGSPENMSIDHVVPRSRGGGASWTNCVVACRRCNERKGNRTLHQSSMKLVRSPEEPSPQMAFTMHLRGRKPSWRNFVDDSFGGKVVSDH